MIEKNELYRDYKKKKTFFIIFCSNNKKQVDKQGIIYVIKL